MNCLKKHKRIILSLVILLLISVGSIAQELYYKQYTDVDGLPSMMTYQMVQDSNGILWIGTENGLVSYNGENFQRYSHPELMDNDIIEMALDKSGRVFFSNLRHQFAFIENHKIHIINSDSVGGKVFDVVTTESKKYALTSLGFKEFYEVQDGEFDFRPTETNIFLESSNIHSPCKKEIRSLEIDSQLILFQKEILFQRINRSNDGRYFYFDYPSYIVEVDSIVYTLIEQKVYKRIVNQQDKTIVILDKGVLIYDAATGGHHSYLENIIANTAFIDKENNLWISSVNEGLFKIPYSDFQFGSKNHALVKDYGVSDLILEDGQLYIGTTTGQFLHYNSQNEIILNVDVSSRSKPVSLINKKNKVYGKSGFNIFIYDKKLRKVKNLESDKIRVKSFLVDNDTVYIGGRQGVDVVNIKDFPNLVIGNERFLQGYWINSIYMDSLNEALYFGSLTGLYKGSKSDSTHFKEIDSANNHNVSCIIGGGEKTLWVGTKNNGVLKLKGDSIVERFNTSNGLISNNVNAIKISNGKLLVSTMEGVTIKDIKTAKIQTINALYGLIPKEVLFCDIIDDEYWLGSNLGLSILHKDQLRYFGNNEPTLSIKNMFANGKKILYEDNIQFSHGINTILINFTNVSLQNGNNKSIKYRVFGTDTSWVYSSDPLIRLQSLKYGDYKIEAIGLNALKVEGNKVSINFRINPPWWQTTWARIFGVLLVLGVFRVVMANRTKRILKEERVKRDYLTQINKIKDQALQLQMNPHFIFNSLNAIQGFIGTEDEEMAMNYLARFARLIRLIFEHSKGRTITLEDELEFINLYLDLEKLRFKDKINVEITIDEELQNAKDLIDIPPLLIQPIIENSFKHGLFHKKGNGNIFIHYALKNDRLQITIQDDGIGREAAEKIGQNNTEKHVSSGIKTTLERIDLLNYERLKKLNSIDIEDLYLKDGGPAGTKTTINLYINKSKILNGKD